MTDNNRLILVTISPREAIEAKEPSVLIRLAHTAKIDAIFQTENGVLPGFKAPTDGRAAELDANLARKWGFLFGVCAKRISTEPSISEY